MYKPEKFSFEIHHIFLPVGLSDLQISFLVFHYQMASTKCSPWRSCTASALLSSRPSCVETRPQPGPGKTSLTTPSLSWATPGKGETNRQTEKQTTYIQTNRQTDKANISHPQLQNPIWPTFTNKPSKRSRHWKCGKVHLQSWVNGC